MDEIVHGTVETPRFAFVLVGPLAALAIMLSAIGIYGVMAYSLSQRTSEFGLRMALGAQRSGVLRLVLGQAATLVFCGTALGLILALVLGRMLQSVIYGARAGDPLTLIAAASLVMAVAVFASSIPARKATQADPIIALRAE